eukprot:11104423-Karenia_brevis.AAC.1
MTLRDAGVVVKLSDVETQHQTVGMMCFGKEGWEVPQEFIQPYLEHDGGNAFIVKLDEDSVVGFDPKDERVNTKNLCTNIHDFVDDESLDNMISSWWKVESHPRKSRYQSFLAGVQSEAEGLSETR